MIMKSFNLPALLVLMIVFLGCQEDSGLPPAGTESVSGFDTKQDPNISGLMGEEGEITNSVAATVNGVTITSSEVQNEAQNLMMQLRDRVPQDQLASMAPTFKQRALDKLITTKLLRDAVEMEKISVEESSIDLKLKEIEDSFPSPDEFEKRLALMGITKDKFRGEISQGLEIEKLLDEKLESVLDVNDEDASEYYAKNQETFKKPEEVKASHILLTTTPTDSEEVKKEKHDKLADIHSQIENGADFAEAASQNSDCPSKSKGGDLGFFSREMMVPPFSEAAFNLKTGELSDIVETKFGYHLIKVTDRHEAGIVPLEEVKEDIKGFLGKQNQQQAFEKYVDGLRENSKIEYGDGYSPLPSTMEG